jgi:hypothetical protein
MLKRVAADPIEFREIYFSMDPRFRDREDEERIEQVRQDILSPGRPTRWKSATIFYLAKSMYLKQSLHIKRSLTAHPGKTLKLAHLPETVDLGIVPVQEATRRFAPPAPRAR